MRRRILRYTNRSIELFLVGAKIFQSFFFRVEQLEDQRQTGQIHYVADVLAYVVESHFAVDFVQQSVAGNECAVGHRSEVFDFLQINRHFSFAFPLQFLERIAQVIAFVLAVEVAFQQHVDVIALVFRLD